MKDGTIPEHLRKYEIPERVAIVRGGGDLPKLSVRTNWSTAEIYLLGAHVTEFQKNGEPPLLFLSQASHFAAGKAIRGGVPIVFPWFGPREGRSQHGFARVTEWEWEGSSAGLDGTVTVRFGLPEDAARADGSPPSNVTFTVTVSDRLTMELAIVNPSATESLSFENCLHTYFAIGDIAELEITGLQGTAFIDKVDNFARKSESAAAIRINSETDRVYLDATGTVEIHDLKNHRKIRVEKSGSASTVIWNPWVVKARQISDFREDEYKQMVCVESGNVAQNKMSLAPGESTSLRVVLSSQPI
ncbi:MAG: D-hexose-6-phosphate mutarotase [Verrucomicrobia bacterium]|nr:D-hexose-6-phosphate mutarotase [Verrucomicrobiota bacterium]